MNTATSTTASTAFTTPGRRALRPAAPSEATAPAHVNRPSPTTRQRGRARSAERLRIEAVLIAAHAAGQALTVKQITARTGLAYDFVGLTVRNMAVAGFCHRNGDRPVAYLLGAGGPPAPAPRASSRELYRGEDLRPNCARPGAMRAFELPSLQAGQRVPRKPPVIMASSVKDPGTR